MLILLGLSICSSLSALTILCFLYLLIRLVLKNIYSHIAVIPPSVRHTPGSVPTEPFGIGNADFNAGLKQSKYGYPVLELYELVRPVTLAEMKSQWGMGGAPMGWRYLTTELWENIWGEDQGRAERMNRVF
jgi:hypothetical protein